MKHKCGLRSCATMFIACLFAASAGVYAQGPATQPGDGKKLIEFGWDEPDTTFMKAHIEQMERTPFNGCVFHVNSVGADGAKKPFLWECWGKRAFKASELAASLDELKATKFTRFTENFLRFNTAPGDLDWFDDFSAVVNNAELAARVAREGKARGLLFDTEAYTKALFDYRAQRDAKTKTWEQYAAQTRLRGSEVMRAMQAGYPDLTVLLTFAYSLPLEQTKADPKKLAETEYGLLAPFLDGMLAEAKGNTRLIDGYELSYGFDDLSEFPPAYKKMKEGVLPFVARPELHARHFSCGFGIWLDNNWRKAGWDVSDLSKNFYSPQKFENSVRDALKHSDKYVWIYTEQPRWWTDRGTPEKLPQAYDEALRKAASTTPAR